MSLCRLVKPLTGFSIEEESDLLNTSRIPENSCYILSDSGTILPVFTQYFTRKRTIKWLKTVAASSCYHYFTWWYYSSSSIGLNRLHLFVVKSLRISNRQAVHQTDDWYLMINVQETKAEILKGNVKAVRDDFVFMWLVFWKYVFCCKQKAFKRYELIARDKR